MREVLVAILLCVGLYCLFDYEEPGVKVYDCSLAEVSPDYPLEVKQECRRINTEKFRKTT